MLGKRIFTYLIMVKDADCSTQNVTLLPSIVTWKYVQDDELVWRLIVNEVSIEGTIHANNINFKFINILSTNTAVFLRKQLSLRI